MCFPGGCIEEKDPSPKHTALREFEEETGIPKEKVEIVGALEPIETRSTPFLIYPYVGIVKDVNGLHIDEREIAKAFFVPLDFLMENHPIEVKPYFYKGVLFNTPILEYQGEIIWGATARILQMLLNKLVPALKQDEVKKHGDNKSGISQG